jgi:chitinase
MTIDGAQGAVRACANLKRQRPYLKTILSIGGAEGNKQNFASAASDAQRRANFAHTARQLVDQYNFDGIDGR